MNTPFYPFLWEELKIEPRNNIRQSKSAKADGKHMPKLHRRSAEQKECLKYFQF